MSARFGAPLRCGYRIFWQLFGIGVFVAGLGIATELRAQNNQEVTFRTPSSEWELSWLDELYHAEFTAQTGEELDWQMPPFETAIRDLDSKPGNAAILVRWTHPDYCTASACQLDVWYWDAPEAIDQGVYRKVLMGIALASTKIGPQKHLGMRDIWVGEIRYRWNGEAYAK